MQRHWTINGRFLGQPLTGVQRYAWEIVRALDAELTADQTLADTLSLDLVAPRQARLPSDLKTIRVRQRGRLRGHLWEQLTLPLYVRDGLLSLGNAGPIAVKRQIVCIHDLNSRAFPQSYSVPFRIMQRVLLPQLGRRCARIATVSGYSAGELARHGLCGAENIVVIPNGFEHVRRWSTGAAAGRVPLPGDRNTIVMIGTPAPHKNMDLILGLADRLRAAGLKIAIVGARDAKVYRSAERAPTSNVMWLGPLSDPDLADLLAACLCLAFPSHVEGFGLPPLEAMALGCPVVVSNSASLPEICGDATLYASPHDPDGWFECFMELRRSESLRQQLIARGMRRAQLFSWRRSAQLYLAAMNQLDRADQDDRSRSSATPRAIAELAGGAGRACSTKTSG